ncbi:alkaline phosphatase D family protein [Haliangium sp.]|uniref:alkaline phosphatase D family protein n=1 Tax=Haliangium sp. TaxID=2663208 RepID=UPI003D0FEED0
MLELSHGPHIGRLTTEGARIWLRLIGDGQARIRFAPGSAASSEAAEAALAGPEARTTDAFAPTAAEHGVLTFDLTDLAADTGYVYRVELSRDDDGFTPGDVGGAVHGSFTTLPAGDRLNGEFVFAFGSCVHPFRTGDRIFDGLATHCQREPVRFMFMLGDQVYADMMPKELAAASPGQWKTPNGICDARSYREAVDFAAYGSAYQAFWGSGAFRRALMRLPIFSCFDDHELADDWGTAGENRDPESADRRAAALRAYDLYQHVLNPETPAGRYWYSFQVGDIGFFALDTRSHRHWQRGAAKVLLDDEQFEALEGWLLATRELPVKFIASSVPLVHISSVLGIPIPRVISAARDQWTGFEAQRRRLLDFIFTNDVRGVYVLSGDVHMSHVARIGKEQLLARSAAYDPAAAAGALRRINKASARGSAPNQVLSFTSSPLTQRSPALHELVALKDHIEDYSVDEIFKGAGKNFGLVRVRPSNPGDGDGRRDYEVSCELLDGHAERFYEYPGRAHIVLDVDRTLSTSGILKRGSVPYVDAARVVRRLHEHFGVIYLTARPRLLPHVGLVRDWLREHGFPASQVIMMLSLWDVLPWRHGKYKTRMINHMIARQQHTPVIGIGDRSTDAEAYRAHQLIPIIIADDDERYDDDVHLVRPGPEQTIWTQIEHYIMNEIGPDGIRERREQLYPSTQTDG